MNYIYGKTLQVWFAGELSRWCTDSWGCVSGRVHQWLAAAPSTSRPLGANPESHTQSHLRMSRILKCRVLMGFVRHPMRPKRTQSTKTRHEDVHLVDAWPPQWIRCLMRSQWRDQRVDHRYELQTQSSTRPYAEKWSRSCLVVVFRVMPAPFENLWIISENTVISGSTHWILLYLTRVE